MRAQGRVGALALVPALAVPALSEGAGDAPVRLSNDRADELVALDGVVAWTRSSTRAARLLVRRNGRHRVVAGIRAPGRLDRLDLGRDPRGAVTLTYRLCVAVERCGFYARRTADGRTERLWPGSGAGCVVEALARWRHTTVSGARCGPDRAFVVAAERGGRLRTVQRLDRPAPDGRRTLPGAGLDRVDVRGTLVIAQMLDWTSWSREIWAYRVGDRRCGRKVAESWTDPDTESTVSAAGLTAGGAAWYDNSRPSGVWIKAVDGACQTTAPARRVPVLAETRLAAADARSVVVARHERGVLRLRLL